jgi:hypothetical protein
MSSEISGGGSKMPLFFFHIPSLCRSKRHCMAAVVSANQTSAIIH